MATWLRTSSSRSRNDRNVLLVIDTCEHLIEACAALVEAVLRGAPRLNILATSREPLRAESERVYRLPSLATPSEQAGATAAEALTFPSVQLFAERAASNLDTFELQDADSPVVGEICRRLDGIPLAIEMAAAYVDVFGMRNLAQRLGDMFLLLTRGRRTALPRHQTLRAMLDWSYALLPATEQATLRRLAMLSGSFMLQEANAVAGESDDAVLISSLTNLVGKSLVSADVNSASVTYRLLDTTRTYAHEKLAESGEFDQIARRHAEYFHSLFAQGGVELASLSATDWIARYGRDLDNARSALDWAFSPSGNVALGVALTIAVTPLWLHLLLNEECRSRVEAALASLDASGRESSEAMQLLAALGNTLLYTKGAGAQANRAWAKTLKIAEKNQDNDYQLRAIRGLWADALNGGEIQSRPEFCRKIR